MSSTNTEANNSGAPVTIGIIRETLIPDETRVPLTPANCEEILSLYGSRVTILVESCPFRCYSDKEYLAAGAKIVEKAVGADFLLGVKPPAVDTLQPGATYALFSHTIKKQPHNRDLLRAVLDKGIRLMDWECMRDALGIRLVGFGRWAGIVGAHNTMMAWGRRSGCCQLFRLREAQDWEAAKKRYADEIKPEMMRDLRVVVTGDGRVGNGACELLNLLGLERLAPQDFLAREWQPGHAGTYTQLPADWLFRKGPEAGWSVEFFSDPTGYHSVIWPFATRANVLINGIFWDHRCAPLLTLEDMRRPDFGIQLVGDITCDIAPVASLPSTLRATTVDDPIFTFDPSSGCELPSDNRNIDKAYVDVMSVDNLPIELPRDSSSTFGELLLRRVVPEMLLPHVAPGGCSRVLQDATIAENGKLTSAYAYLQDYADGEC
uniref:AlaDh_PNT_N domain-containing protein n=1 Tax=Macrostomum lignano TaxID=282301 RepID=A0A1I8I4M3_9PLAT